jgi:hypothetical protein
MPFGHSWSDGDDFVGEATQGRGVFEETWPLLDGLADGVGTGAGAARWRLLSNEGLQNATEEEAANIGRQEVVDEGEGHPDGTEGLKRLDKADLQDGGFAEVCGGHAGTDDEGLSQKKGGSERTPAD